MLVLLLIFYCALTPPPHQGQLPLLPPGSDTELHAVAHC